ncbi:MAG: cysteine desulfurase [Pseudomonadota bacterium]|nr:cysteine desulfurase [Pseudomonadota bacterium]
MASKIYLDCNATAPVRPEAAQAMQELLAVPANPSSVHAFGREAKKYLERARKTIAEAVSAWPNEIIFTASGTEANATALHGFSGRRVLTSAVEHSSVLKQLLRKEIIPATSSGIINLSALDVMLAADSTPALVSVMLANNETGVIQPLAEISAICKRHNALLHCDAVQALGKIPVDFGALGTDMLTLSGHKCGGPVGAAALVLRRDLAMVPLLAGGGQELGRRAGTENVAAIAGFAKVVEMIDLAQMQRLRRWLDGMEQEMEAGGGAVFGKDAPRLPNTSCIAMPGVSNEVQLMDFDLKGFAVSAGSACSSARVEVSHVLLAMGVPKALASSAIRVSGGWATTEQEIRRFAEAWQQMAARLAKKAG